MLLIDNLIIALILLSTLVGFYRGFFPEAVSLASWIVAVWVAWQFSGVLEPYLDAKIGSPVIATWVARFVLFAGVLIVGGLVNALVSLAVEKTGLSGTDRMLGLVFGFGRGVLVFGVLVLFAGFLEMSAEPWWADSKLIPYGETLAGWIRDVLPDELASQIELPVGDTAP